MNLKTSIFGRYLQVIYDLNLNKSEEAHNALISAIYKLFVIVRGDIDKARLEMCIQHATGAWLDYWGSFFGITRLKNETDSKYSIRMIEEIIQPKGSVRAIQMATARWLNNQEEDGTVWEYDDIQVVEPWQDLMRLSHRGLLSHTARLWDNFYYCYGRIDIVLPDSTEITPELINYLRKVKAAGVQILWTITNTNWEIISDFFNVNTYYYERTLEVDTPVDYIPHGFRTNYADNFPNYEGNPEIPDLGSYEVNKTTDCIDSIYNESFLSVEGMLSGKPLIWAEVVAIWRDTIQVRQRIHSYYYSGTIKASDIATIGEKEYDTMTLGEIFDLEDTSDILSADGFNKPYTSNPLNVSQSGIEVSVEPLINDRELVGIAFNKPVEKWFVSTLTGDLLAQYQSLQSQDHLYSDMDITDYYSYPQLLSIAAHNSTSLPPYKYFNDAELENNEMVTVEEIAAIRNSMDNKLLWIESTSDNVLTPFEVVVEEV